MKELYVIGGGAAGLAAALSAAGAGAQVTVLEGLDKVGKKILATGNGRCNLTNRDMSPAHYHSSSPRELARLLEQMPVERTLRFFEDFHLLTDTEELGRVYPHSRQASTVRDTLLWAMESQNIRVLTGHRVNDIRPHKGGFQISCESGGQFRADAVILTAGGSAAPKQGTDGSGFALTQKLGHRLAPVYPCLTAFRCDSPLCKGLKGVRAHGRLELWVDGKRAGGEDGEIQFTDYGLSGIPAFQLSCLLKPGWKSARLTVDLLPEQSEEEVLRLLSACRQHPKLPLIDALPPGLIHPKLLMTALKAVRIPYDRTASAVSGDDLARLSRQLKQFSFPVTGVQGWDQAQVTGGGVKLTEIDESFRSRLCPNLWLAGEVLDAVGDCGGYNLHWAWCSGMLAGQAAARQPRSQAKR